MRSSIRSIRQAGAIVLAAAIWRSSPWSAARGQLDSARLHKNAYEDPLRTVAGSSGGTAAAVASNFATEIDLGTDAGSSVRAPTAFDSLVRFRPTLGMTWWTASFL